MQPYRDPLAILTDDDLRLFQQPVEIKPYVRDEWWERFKDMDRYDWDDPTFLKRNVGKNAFLPIPLSQGYFMLVPKSKYRSMSVHKDGSPKKWHAKIDRDQEGNVFKVYGRRSGRGDEPRTVFSHREITSTVHSACIVDHCNGWGLDNRLYNLRPVNSQRENMSNNTVRRRVNHELPRGVETRSVNKDGKPQYRGIRARRLKSGRVQIVRSKRTWLSPEPAHRWYQNQLKKIYRRVNWAHTPMSVSYPTLPPLKQQECTTFPRTRALKVLENIATPF